MKNQRAFTLLEILIALTIFAVAAISIFVVFPACSMAVRQSKEYTDIAFLLESQLAQAQATPFSQLAAKTISSGLPSYVQRVDWTVTDVPGFSELKQVDIQVSYTSKGRAKTELVSTYVANL